MAVLVLRSALNRPLSHAEMDGNLQALNQELAAALASLVSLSGTLATKADATAMNAALAGKANSGHTHVLTDVTGLESALNNKAALNHGHEVSEITGLEGALASLQPLLGFQNTGVDVGGPITGINFLGFTITRVGGVLTVQATGGGGGSTPTGNGLLTRSGNRLVTRSNDVIVWR